MAGLLGIVLFKFFADATSQGMVALVHRESLLRRMRLDGAQELYLGARTSMMRRRPSARWRFALAREENTKGERNH